MPRIIPMGFRGSVGSEEALKSLERPLNEIWNDYSSYTRDTTATKIRLLNLFGIAKKRVYRGMWLTADELAGIAKKGIISEQGAYQNYIFFSPNPAEAIRYAAQGANQERKPRGIFVLFAADPRKGKIVLRPRPAGDGLMSSPTALDQVSADSITNAWVYDPNLGEDSVMRVVDLTGLRDR